MTNNADAQIARQWAEGFIKHADSAQIVDADALTAARHILATTKPLTMWETKWNNDEHAGLCAERKDHGLVRMLAYDAGEEIVWCMDTSGLTDWARLDQLTPVPGEKIDLTPRRPEDVPRGEVPEFTPDHPAVLITREDYRNAPEGTIVAAGFCHPWVKSDSGFWLACGEDGGRTSPGMAFAARRVLRWGETL